MGNHNPRIARDSASVGFEMEVVSSVIAIIHIIVGLIGELFSGLLHRWQFSNEKRQERTNYKSNSVECYNLEDNE